MIGRMMMFWPGLRSCEKVGKPLLPFDCFEGLRARPVFEPGILAQRDRNADKDQNAFNQRTKIWGSIHIMILRLGL
jgi:hypothetical protein